MRVDKAGDDILSAPRFDEATGARLRRASRVVGLGTLSAASFVVIVLLWAAAIDLFEIPKYLLPAPMSVLTEIVTSRDTLFRNGMITMREIFLGFGLTLATAVPLGLFIALSPLARRMIYPMLVFIQLIPKIAIAPLFVVWVGFGIESKILLTVMMTFFPLMIASITGFQILDPRYLYLTKSMGANYWQTFRYLRLPSALPVIFSGLRTSATIAATAAIVAEFVGSNRGLVFAVLAILTVIGLALNYLVEGAEYLMMPWRKAR
jgi:NitT/TauT family transport system permease protein